MKFRNCSLMSHTIGVIFILVVSLGPAYAEDATDELTGLLNTFLAGASIDSEEAHDRFWAEDLVYTSSSGTRFGKAEIMDGIAESDSTDTDEPATVYSAEQIQVKQYGNTAVVAFRLVGVDQDESSSRIEYFNTGTFLKRNDEWRVVAWQATRIPDEDDKS